LRGRELEHAFSDIADGRDPLQRTTVRMRASGGGFVDITEAQDWRVPQVVQTIAGAVGEIVQSLRSAQSSVTLLGADCGVAVRGQVLPYFSVDLRLKYAKTYAIAEAKWTTEATNLEAKLAEAQAVRDVHLVKVAKEPHVWTCFREVPDQDKDRVRVGAVGALAVTSASWSLDVVDLHGQPALARTGLLKVPVPLPQQPQPTLKASLVPPKAEPKKKIEKKKQVHRSAAGKKVEMFLADRSKRLRKFLLLQKKNFGRARVAWSRFQHWREYAGFQAWCVARSGAVMGEQAYQEWAGAQVTAGLADW